MELKEVLQVSWLSGAVSEGREKVGGSGPKLSRRTGQSTVTRNCWFCLQNTEKTKFQYFMDY